MAASTPRPKAPAPSGVLIVDKPRGPTSHDVVARVRRALSTRHVGHAGTLDPMATGVLVIAVGEATKLVPWLTADDKTYETTVRLGVETDTLDAEGTETSRAPVPDELARALRDGSGSPLLDAAVAVERARTAQVPPAFSAIRVGGRRAHELARAGRLEADLPERPVEVRALDVLGGRADDGVELVLRVASTKGYFVRSLARDLARGLGTVGHLTALRRVRSGAFTVDDAIALDAVRPDALIGVADAAARALPVTVLDEEGVRAVSYGRRVAPEQMTAAHPRPSAWLDRASRLVAIGERGPDGWGRVLRGFPAPAGA
ncbi:MAG: tRNA pseudouridine(55) synthase TruB [Labilithrix sp.]|nr:tRNA pseudouridine(55) synthase TruB [Labilithrix sp.]